MIRSDRLMRRGVVLMALSLIGGIGLSGEAVAGPASTKKKAHTQLPAGKTKKEKAELLCSFYSASGLHYVLERTHCLSRVDGLTDCALRVTATKSNKPFASIEPVEIRLPAGPIKTEDKSDYYSVTIDAPEKVEAEGPAVLEIKPILFAKDVETVFINRVNVPDAEGVLSEDYWVIGPMSAKAPGVAWHIGNNALTRDDITTTVAWRVRNNYALGQNDLVFQLSSADEEKNEKILKWNADKKSFQLK